MSNQQRTAEDLDLQAFTEEELAMEELPEGTAPSLSWGTASSAGSASCPGSTASSVSTIGPG